MKVAVFLYDYTGIMAKPWADAGYLCFCFDGQHPQGVTKADHKNILNVGMWFNKNHDGSMIKSDVERILSVTGFNISFVFGFPEYTDLAVSGAAHFKSKYQKNPNFQEEAMILFYIVERLGKKIDCPWALENPVSRASTLWKKPCFSFNPYEFGGYLPEDDQHPIWPEYIKPRDAYPKKTCIWTGNGFNKPETKPVECAPGYSDQHKKLGGKSLKTKNIRSATPRGFAKAVFLANSKGENNDC